MTRTRSFETSPWSHTPTPEVPVARIRLRLTVQDVEEATWSLHHNPVSVALHRLLKDQACATMFWNSDAPAPQYAGDDARIGIHISKENGEDSYWMPLPARATRAMWKLRCGGMPAFQPLTIALDLPREALAPNPAPAAAD